MSSLRIWMLRASSALLLLGAAGIYAAEDVPEGTPDAIVDLATRDGVALVKGAWKYHDVAIREVEFRSVGHDLKASGPPNRTNDFEPHAGAADFDDSS